MPEFLNRLFRLERGEWPKLLQFGLFGFLLQTGMGIGFSAGDAAFLSHVGADRLPLVFMLTPLVMLFYTVVFSYLMVRFSIGRTVDVTMAMLVTGGLGFWALIGSDLPPGWQAPLYFALKLYLAMWYIALYSLFWNYTDAYFDIQDAKRMFPLFAAFCAFGTATGALIVSVFADVVPVQQFFLLWAVIAIGTFPLARLLQRRWRQIAESDADFEENSASAVSQLAAVAKAFGQSRYTVVFTLTLFVTLLMTNLAEYQYSMVLQKGRDEAGLAALFGALYAAANLFNLVTCLFVFNRLVGRLGVRNVAFIQPLTYFAVFGWFFLQGGTGAALAAFFAYHGVLTSIEYNNQNLLFNAVPSRVKRPLRTVMEGMAEPLASLVAGGLLLYAASRLDLRELSGIGIITGGALIAIVVALRQLYPLAMTTNMRQGWMNFGDSAAASPEFEPEARAALEQALHSNGPAAQLARALLETDTLPPPSWADTREVDELVALLAHEDPQRRRGVAEALFAAASAEDIHIVSPLASRLPALEPAERQCIIALLEHLCDSEAIDDVLLATAELAPRERRAIVTMLTGIGETAIPRLIAGMRQRSFSLRARAIAARALAELSYAQFAAHLDRLVREELHEARNLLDSADVLDDEPGVQASLMLLARAQRERVGATLDFVLELLAIGGLLPNFDLLIVSLHSANAKVRGNAIESIESGIDGQLFRLLEPLLLPRALSPRSGKRARSMDQILRAALTSGQPVEMALAADALYGRLDAAEFAARIQDVIQPGMPGLLRGHLLALMGFDDGQEWRLLDLLGALASDPELRVATLESLLVLAETVQDHPAPEGALQGMAGGKPFWVAFRALRNVAERFPDLALVLLKAQYDRRYAA
ncbi:MFS transporter [Novosphingobium album (ex Hu et al. 2023)]|uniref:MFS transporter n=1 Tax=Novosphingobium album (ex Hu et al. 2023) TaxID=2930093 RepID=A0ABT0AXF0_9SPHN|nr:MFS transporter [Novosphingobium album (ex Hu et al. 2023)]MCJ2177484.1 MFS transporter [Novosphingobium album (ex Hu et al. 2023)]